MTPPDELTRRAEEEVAKELNLKRQGKGWDVEPPVDLLTLWRKTFALSVRLMRYKLQVREAEKEMELEELLAIDDDSERLGIHSCLKILTKHTQEEQ